MRIYQPGETWISGEFASLLAIGDSWFWYPRNNILGALARHPRLKDPFRNIQVLGYNGARLEEYVFGRYAKRFSLELEPRNRQYYSAILVSGAGNDAVDYSLGLFRDCSAATAPDRCINDESMHTLLTKLGTALGALLDQVTQAYSKDEVPRDIFLHTYDYPYPDGRGFSLPGLEITGPWLATAMDKCQVPNDPALRKDICIRLIDRLAQEFKRFADPAKRIYLINSHGCLKSHEYQDDWDNELHPTPRGFAKIVDECWIPAFVEHGYAK